jgi:hypothetical protein
VVGAAVAVRVGVGAAVVATAVGGAVGLGEFRTTSSGAQATSAVAASSAAMVLVPGRRVTICTP